jgi:hypothetical protein
MLTPKLIGMSSNHHENNCSGQVEQLAPDAHFLSARNNRKIAVTAEGIVNRYPDLNAVGAYSAHRRR